MSRHLKINLQIFIYFLGKTFKSFFIYILNQQIAVWSMPSSFKGWSDRVRDASALSIHRQSSVVSQNVNTSPKIAVHVFTQVFLLKIQIKNATH